MILWPLYRYLSRGLAVAAAALLGSTPGLAETPVERGSYLVNAVMACDNCHTPRGPAGLDMERRFSGGSITWDEPSYKVVGPNITTDQATGIGAWSDADIERALTDGVKPDGTPLAPIMPFAFYKILTEFDLSAIVAYLRTVPPQRNEVAQAVYKAEMPVIEVPGGEKPIPQAELRDPLERGFYLATLAHCMECHARGPDGSHDLRNRLGTGGFVLEGRWGSAVTPNITSHPISGIGSWADGDIKTALTQGIDRDGRKFAVPMARANYFSRMTAADLDALVAYIRSLPPLE